MSLHARSRLEPDGRIKWSRIILARGHIGFDIRPHHLDRIKQVTDLTECVRAALIAHHTQRLDRQRPRYFEQFDQAQITRVLSLA